MSRRDFLASACGTISTLLAFDQVLGCDAGGGVGGAAGSGARYAVSPAAALDDGAAAAAVGGNQFILDAQTHHVNPDRDWSERNHAFDFIRDRGGSFASYTRDRFIKEVFLDSETDMAVLNALAGAPRDNPLLIEEAQATRDAVAALGRGQRLLLQGIVMPNLEPLEAQLDGMHVLMERWKVAAWKLYPGWGPRGTGYWLDDPERSIPVIERARQLGLCRFAVHKGRELPGIDPKYTRTSDVGTVARLFPDVIFLVDLAVYETELPGGAHGGAATGIDGLIRSLRDNGIPPNSNVHVVLGSGWCTLMHRPVRAAHVLGKLLLHVGEDRVLWGTDAIWNGSPEGQIQAFRAFEISAEMQEKYGYPALDGLQKRKIFGLNAAKAYELDPRALRP